MDSVFSSLRLHHRPSPPPPTLSPDQTPPPPPRQPITRGHPDTDLASPTRPCPPPPLPAREPLSRARHGGDHPGRAGQAPAANTALDSVVPLTHWPLRSVGPRLIVDKPRDDVRRGTSPQRGVSPLPVNMLAAQTVHHTAAPTSAVAAQPPTACSNGGGNVYVDSPTVSRNGAVVSGGPGSTLHPATTGDRPALIDCRATLQPPSNHTSTSPGVKFNSTAGNCWQAVMFCSPVRVSLQLPRESRPPSHVLCRSSLYVLYILL